MLPSYSKVTTICGCLSTASPGFRELTAAARRSALDNLGIRDLDRARWRARAACAKSCRANARDEAKLHLRVIHRAPCRDRSDTWQHLSTGETAVILLRLRKTVRRGREETRSARCARRLRFC